MSDIDLQPKNLKITRRQIEQCESDVERLEGQGAVIQGVQEAGCQRS
jgi:hypothetical protein